MQAHVNKALPSGCRGYVTYKDKKAIDDVLKERCADDLSLRRTTALFLSATVMTPVVGSPNIEANVLLGKPCMFSAQNVSLFAFAIQISRECLRRS